MIRAALSALALLMATPAAAQQAPAYKDYTAAFDRFATETAAVPTAERVRLFRERFNALVPGFYAPRNGATEERYNIQVEKALAAYPAKRAAFLKAAREFDAAYVAANAHFRRAFPDYAPTMPIYLIHSLNEMDGGTRELEGRVVALFGADVIASIHDSASIGSFLDHELFHFHHQRFFADCEALWCSLWQEGLATYVAGAMNPGADDRALMLTIPRPIRAEVEARFAQAICRTRAKFDSTDQTDYAEYFYGKSVPDAAFPPRFGYYVGYRIAQELGETRSLEQLTRMPAVEVKTAMLQALSAMADCPA